MTSTSIDRRFGLTGNKAYKAPCALATTGNITLSGEQTIDGTLTNNTDVLVWQQTNSVENGFWVSSTGAWTRRADANTNQDLGKGTQVYVSGGTAYAGNRFAITANDPINPGTTSITIAQTTDSSTLEARLASTASAADNAGLVGFNGVLDYSAQADNTVGGMLHTAYGATSWEDDAGIVPTNYGYIPGDVRRYGVDPASSDVTDALEVVAAILPYLWFPLGTYRITRTIQRCEFSRWVGQVPQSNENGAGDNTPEVVIFGTTANIGSGNPLVRLCESNVAASSFVTENISFQSDLSVNTSDLAAMTSTAPVGVNVDHAKNGTEFINCSFRNLRHAIHQNDTDPYCDKITLTRCHITRCYLAINANPTAGLSLVDTFIYDCRDWIQSSTDVSLVAVSLNNSSVASETCGVLGRNIDVLGGWIEGGNRVFRPSAVMRMSGMTVSEMLSAATKYLCEPQNDNVSFDLSNFRVPTNTRLINLGSVTLNTITVKTFGLRDGVNFSNVADINTQVEAGLQYSGFGNLNTAAWNIAEGVSRNAKNTDYTFVRTDASKLLYHSSGSGHTWTIPAGASVPYPLGTEINGVNDGAGAITLAITTDTLRWGAMTGSRTIAQHGSFTLRLVASGVWRLTGDGIT